MPEFGVLTLATDNDYLKAIGLALSLRVTNPAVPLAIACNASVAEKAGRFFDHVIPEQAGLRGFVHKVYLDRYSPSSARCSSTRMSWCSRICSPTLSAGRGARIALAGDTCRTV
jgi:hypothetical protein